MGPRFVPALLLALLVILHAQIWFGRGSVSQVGQLRTDLATQTLANEQATRRNERLSSEVDNLRDGLDMVEELARQDLGMVKPNEIFVLVTDAPPPSSAAAPAPTAPR